QQAVGGLQGGAQHHAQDQRDQQDEADGEHHGQREKAILDEDQGTVGAGSRGHSPDGVEGELHLGKYRGGTHHQRPETQQGGQQPRLLDARLGDGGLDGGGGVLAHGALQLGDDLAVG